MMSVFKMPNDIEQRIARAMDFFFGLHAQGKFQDKLLMGFMIKEIGEQSQAENNLMVLLILCLTCSL